MSEFFRALGQAERDRALREQARLREPASAEDTVTHEEPAPVEAPVEAPPAAPPTIVTPPEPIVPAAPPAPAESGASPFMRRRPSRPAADRRPVDLADDDGLHGIEGHLVSLLTPATFEAEQYRGLRHLIEELHRSSGLTLVAVSSPSVGDGKTTTAINLAGALAQSPEARVLLIDADLRRPSVVTKMGLRATPGPGLVGALVDRRLSLAEAVRRRPPFNLEVLPAGDTPAAPYELLKSPRFGELLEEARKRYDYVIVDTPPMVAVPDCRIIANFVDGFVVVVAAHRTPRRLVEEALSVVEPAKMLGLVFNRDDRPLSAYDAHAYGTYANGNGNGQRKWRWGQRA